jgi:hypothetical protein
MSAAVSSDNRYSIAGCNIVKNEDEQSIEKQVQTTRRMK